MAPMMELRIISSFARNRALLPSSSKAIEVFESAQRFVLAHDHT